MNTPQTKVLLALLLALKSLESPLNPDEQAALYTIGGQLELDPVGDWEFIQEGLMTIIDTNASLKELYHNVITQLDGVDGNIPPDCLPTAAELERELPQKSYLEVRGYFEGNADLESNEILNATVVVLRSDNPAATTKKLSFLEKIQKLLTPSTNQGKSNP